MGSTLISTPPTSTTIHNNMNLKVLLVFSVSAILAANAGVLSREKRTLGLVKYGAAQVAAHPVKAAAAVLGAHVLRKFLKGKNSAPAPVAAEDKYDYWYESIPGGDSEPWVTVDTAESPVNQGTNSGPLLGAQGGVALGPLSINAGISAGRR